MAPLGRERGTTSIIVTHDPRILEDADRIVTLEDGRLATDERRGAILSSRTRVWRKGV